MAKDKKLKKSKNLEYNDGKLSPEAGAGQNNTILFEKQPEYARAECETVFPEEKSHNNARIIFGRDRHAGFASGYGGKGHTRAGAIDLVVGLQGWEPGDKYREAKYNSKGELTRPESFGFADKNFGSMNNGQPGDAARIYITQRGDIDKYFDICDGEVGSSIAESAIGMKADSIRIMARKGIKIVTGKSPPGRTSLDGEINTTYGIDLIAGNRDFKTGLESVVQDVAEILAPNKYRPQPLQPIPKGDNLKHFLDDVVVENMLLLNAISAGLLNIMPLICRSVLRPKQGLGPTGPISTFPGLQDLSDVSSYMILMRKQSRKMLRQQSNLTSERSNYLAPR